jgi:transcriptional regulator with XRE-family HTH domain
MEQEVKVIDGGGTMTFAEKLRELRDAAGLSQVKLARASGLTFGTVHGYGLGRRKPSFANVLKIARALGTTCEAFADCEDLDGVEPPARKRKAAPIQPAKGKKGKGK